MNFVNPINLSIDGEDFMNNVEQVLSTNQIGQIGQSYFEFLMSQWNIPCFKPIGSYLYDYIIVYDNTPLRVECKASNIYNNGAITFPINHSVGRKNLKPYSAEDVDIIFCYSVITKEYCFLSSSHFSTCKSISIREKDGIAKNNVKYPCFNDYDFHSVCTETLHNMSNVERRW